MLDEVRAEARVCEGTVSVRFYNGSAKPLSECGYPQWGATEMQKLLLTVAVLGGIAFGQGKTTATRSDPWEPLRFLIGSWEAKTQGGLAGASGTGAYTFRLELRDHVLARHSSTSDCKGPADYNCEHGDLLYIYPGAPGKPLEAMYFDNEGHVIRYEVASPAPQRAVFTAYPSQAGPQYRLIYQLNGKLMEGKFQIRMPGQADFQSYLEWRGEKRADGAVR